MAALVVSPRMEQLERALHEALQGRAAEIERADVRSIAVRVQLQRGRLEEVTCQVETRQHLSHEGPL